MEDVGPMVGSNNWPLRSFDWKVYLKLLNAKDKEGIAKYKSRMWCFDQVVKSQFDEVSEQLLYGKYGNRKGSLMEVAGMDHITELRLPLYEICQLSDLKELPVHKKAKGNV